MRRGRKLLNLQRRVAYSSLQIMELIFYRDYRKAPLHYFRHSGREVLCHTIPYHTNRVRTRPPRKSPYNCAEWKIYLKLIYRETHLNLFLIRIKIQLFVISFATRSVLFVHACHGRSSLPSPKPLQQRLLLLHPTLNPFLCNGWTFAA